MNLTQLHSNINGVIDNLKSIVLDLAMESKPSIVELNKEQLWEGKTNMDDDISPKYSENPYFKTKEAASRYADWKQKITPGKSRNKDVPNLYINGKFYSSIIQDLSANYIDVQTNSELGRKVTAVHKNVLGLGAEKLKVVSNNIKEPLINTLKNELTRS